MVRELFCYISKLFNGNFDIFCNCLVVFSFNSNFDLIDTFLGTLSNSDLTALAISFPYKKAKESFPEGCPRQG